MELIRTILRFAIGVTMAAMMFGTAPAYADPAEILDRAKTLSTQKDPQSLLEYGRLLRNGVPPNTANPLIVPKYEQAHAAFEQALLVQGPHLTNTRISLAKMLLNGEGGQVEFDRAIELLQRAANDGSGEAAYILGEQLIQVSGRVDEAIAQFQAALRVGYGPAGLALQQYYQNQDPGLAQSMLSLSLSLLEQQANAGESSAAFALAEYYRGVAAEVWPLRRAFEWYQKAYALGHERSLYWLARMQADRQTELFNPTAALDLYTQAAERGSIPAALELIRDHASKGPLGVSNELAGRWTTLLLQTGDTNAQIIYAKEVSNSLQERKQFSDNVYAQLMAEKVPEIEALLTLGAQFRDGEGVAVDKDRALKLFERGAVRGSKDAILRYAELLVGTKTLQTPDEIKKGFDWINTIANSGSISGAVVLGDMYLSGFGTNVDQAEAIRWYELAADSGNSVESMTRLADIYSRDTNIEIRRKALDWLTRAANQGSLRSQMALADAYVRGDIVGRDVFRAIEYYQRAVDGKAGGALEALADLYLRIGGDASHELARKVFEDAVAGNYPDAVVKYGRFLVQNGEGQAAIELLDYPEFNKRVDVALLLRSVYANGLNGKVDKDRAYAWLERAVAGIGEDPKQRVAVAAALLGSTSPQFEIQAVAMLQELQQAGVAEAGRHLGRAQILGIGTAKNVPAGIESYKTATLRGDPDAQVELADFYANGINMPADVPLSVSLYEGVLKEVPDDAAANLRLGNIYADGSLGMPDLTKAAKYYERAAAMGNSSAQRAIGTQYFWGAGVAQSADNAAKWLQAAAASGSTQAFADLAVLNNSAMVTTITPGLAFTYNFEAAKRSYVPAMLEVGISLVQGFGIPANPASGISWLERAANAGSNEAMYDLYQIYVEGYGVGKNPAHADKWLQVAAASGNGSALFRQALTLMSVKTPEAESQAVALLKKAAKVKHNQSKKLLVKMGLMSPSDADDGGEVEVEAIE